MPSEGVCGREARALTRHTDIWLVVSVPVLSEQMTEVQPSVSTDGSERTMAFFLAMRRVPSARQVVMTAGRPSGMAATATKTPAGDEQEGERERRRTECDGDLEVVDGTAEPRSTMNWIGEVTDVDSPYCHADNGDNLHRICKQTSGFTCSSTDIPSIVVH